MNYITPAMLSPQGNIVGIPLKVTVMEVFKDRFRQAPQPQLLDWIAPFPSLASDQTVNIELPFSEEEILQSLKDADGDRALGPNGFSFKFAQSFWNTFKGDLVGLFQTFYFDAEFDHRFSESFISLIPKVKGPSLLNDFHPISLLRWIHKLVTKVLTSRLRRFIDHLVSHTQTVFIRGCSIYDGWVVASELLDVMQRKKEGLIFKLDFGKALRLCGLVFSHIYLA